ncbi:MAG: transglycosylase SLT domain-containing protein, partial [Cyanobacteria bacterium P01_H01_bin.130]
TQEPAERQAALTALAQGEPSVTQWRARYLLAGDAIAQNQPAAAVQWLENLEEEYGVLGDQIRAMRLKALAATGDSTVPDQWRSLLESAELSDFLTVEANYALRDERSAFWDGVISGGAAAQPSTEADSPADNVYLKQHPKTIAVVKERLQATPEDPQLLRHLVRYAPDDPNIGTYLVKLEKRHSDILSPEEWEAIAGIYWSKFQYRQAGEAYTKASSTPRNAYRAGRGLQLGGKKPEAIAAYQRAIRQFPEAPETGEARVKLATLLPPQDRLELLSTTTAQFPHLGGEVTLLQAAAFDELKSPTTAAQLRQKLLFEFGGTETAAELRWDLAWKAAQNNRIADAITQAQALVTNAPDSTLAPQAGFWLGKWYSRGNQSDAAIRSYQFVLKNHPDSYYAWRSADELGLPVGNFTTVRQLRPNTQLPTTRSPLPVGSPALQELYQLHLDDAAWEEWQAQRNQRSPSVPEQYTDGIMRQLQGDNLRGIFLLSNLAWRDLPEERADYEALSQTDAYWHALYKLPYGDAIAAAAENRNFHPLLVAGLIRQESRFEKDIVSVAGAIGLMQVLPGTGDWGAREIGLPDFDLRDPIDNLALGTWFLDYTHEQYDGNSMYAIASYNAGPGNIAKWIERFNPQDFDQFVEQIPFPETRNYFKAVLGNYWNYVRLYDTKTQTLIQQAVGP